MKKTITKKVKNTILEVNIETVNNYFSITGNLWEKLRKNAKHSEYNDYKTFDDVEYVWVMGGCIHDLILQHFPQLQSIVSLHLSDLEGKPMYYIENDLRNDLNKGLDYWRVKEEHRIGIKNTEQALTLLPILLEQWKQEANEAIKLIESL